MEKNKFTHGSLFSGIGGSEIAAEIMGWKNMFHCEINPFGRKILDYWFPNSKSYEDITKTDFTEWRGKINVLTGGFPCQPFSCAGQRKGAEDDRYLWPEMLRAIREIQPDWVVGENVTGILSMVQPGSETALGREESLFGEVDRERILHRQEYVVETVCNDLEREGYFVQPVVVPACAVGAPHRRDRVFFIAHRADSGVEGMQRKWEDNILSGRTAPDTDSHRWRNGKNQQVTIAERKGTANIGTFREDGTSSYSQCSGSGQIYKEVQSEQPNGHSFDSNGGKRNVAYSKSQQSERYKSEQPTSGTTEQRELGRSCCENNSKYAIREWKNFPTQSPVCSRDDGISTRLDGIAFSKWRQESIKAYGNAIVPQVMYEIFQAIQETYNQ
jgi:DNA (cytosine-5)-methyltransferase 1